MPRLNAEQDIFRLKQFSLSQLQAPIKVGTDALLLGAWSAALKQPNQVSQVLDIGTGTGILALMMAQRFQNAAIHALEIDPTAQVLAEVNFQASQWSHRLHLHLQSLQVYSAQSNLGVENLAFDLILSNPPYFPLQSHSPQAARARGRSQIDLHWSDILAFASQRLNTAGQLALILPVQEWAQLLAEALRLGLSPVRFCWVAGHVGVPAKRLLSAWSRLPFNPFNERLIVRQGASPGSEYSLDYLQLLKAYFPGLSNREAQT
ncbi:MAG: methyltransferase [Candidatus Sericytochromatia bacterium]|nr:methyltransferase [Candidatus Sericytochromatia bacterium]